MQSQLNGLDLNNLDLDLDIEVIYEPIFYTKERDKSSLETL